MGFGRGAELLCFLRGFGANFRKDIDNPALPCRRAILQYAGAIIKEKITAFAAMVKDEHHGILRSLDKDDPFSINKQSFT